MQLKTRLKIKNIVNRTRPYARKYYRGSTLDNRTISAFEWAEKHYIKQNPKRRVKWVISQGSYNTTVAASAGTHDGGGAVDLSTTGMSQRQIEGAVFWLRKAGFAAWYRAPLPGVWGPHIHAVLIGHRTAAWLAKQQWSDYKNRLDGLAGRRPDNSWHPNKPIRWSHLRNKPVKKH